MKSCWKTLCSGMLFLLLILEASLFFPTDTVDAAARPTLVAAQTQENQVTLEWLTWSFFRLTSPTGKVILTNPWVTNPDSKITLADITKADVILVADGHRDEVGETAQIAKQTGAKVITTWELAGGYLAMQDIPNEQFIRVQPGSRVVIDDITIRVVNAIHGSGVPDPKAPYGGPALGFFVTFENGLTVYFSGSTDLTMDMQLWGSLFKPDVAILILSRDRDPAITAQMARFLSTDNPNLQTVIPHHHRLSPAPGSPTPEDLAAAIKTLGLTVSVLSPEVGKIYTLTQ